MIAPEGAENNVMGQLVDHEHCALVCAGAAGPATPTSLTTPLSPGVAKLANLNTGDDADVWVNVPAAGAPGERCAVAAAAADAEPAGPPTWPEYCGRLSSGQRKREECCRCRWRNLQANSAMLP